MLGEKWHFEAQVGFLYWEADVFSSTNNTDCEMVDSISQPMHEHLVIRRWGVGLVLVGSCVSAWIATAAL